LGLLRLGDVAGYGGGADDAAGRVPDGRGVDGDADDRAVFADAPRLVVGDAAPGGRRREEFTDLGVEAGGGDHADVAADDRRRGVAVGLLRAQVPTRDPAVQRLADDGVVGRFDDGRELRPGLLGALEPGDVDGDAAAL